MRRPQGAHIPDEDIRDLDPLDLPVVPERVIGLHERHHLNIVCLDLCDALDECVRGFLLSKGVGDSP